MIFSFHGAREVAVQQQPIWMAFEVYGQWLTTVKAQRLLNEAYQPLSLLGSHEKA